jgi:hypothetical protein
MAESRYPSAFGPVWKGNGFFSNAFIVTASFIQFYLLILYIIAENLGGSKVEGERFVGTGRERENCKL